MLKNRQNDKVRDGKYTLHKWIKVHIFITFAKDLVQKANTKTYGQLCVYVLDSLSKGAKFSKYN